MPLRHKISCLAMLCMACAPAEPEVPNADAPPLGAQPPEPAPLPEPEPELGPEPVWEPEFVATRSEPNCEPQACVRQGLDHYATVVGSETPRKVREEAYMMQRRACSAGVQAGCYEQATLLRSGLVFAFKVEELARARATKLLQSSCEGGWGRSCYRLGEDHHDTQEGHRLYKRAIQLYEPACEGGDMEQCSLLAYNLQLGRGAMVDIERAMKLYQKACDGGDGYGCDALGLILSKGKRGVANDPAAAVVLFKRACELGAPYYGCYEAGVRLARGRGVKARISEGVDLLRSGCTDAQGEADARACNELEDLCREGFKAACS